MKNKKEKIDRRGFIEQSAKITAAGIMLSRLPAKSKKLFSIEGEIKVAIIGCGGRGTGARRPGTARRAARPGPGSAAARRGPPRSHPSSAPRTCRRSWRPRRAGRPARAMAARSGSGTASAVAVHPPHWRRPALRPAPATRGGARG